MSETLSFADTLGMNLNQPLIMGLECGGTKTLALVTNESLKVVAELKAGPANLRLLSDDQLRNHFCSLAAALPQPSAIGIGMAGARTERDRERVRQGLSAAWPRIPVTITHDLEIALRAVDFADSAALAKVIVLSGTGSCCFGQGRDTTAVKIGGWGHLIGDKGSGYEIALRALKAIVYYLDRDGTWTILGKSILASLLLNEPEQLINWSLNASKSEIAALAVEVFKAAAQKDFIATDILEGAANSLAKDAICCANRLGKKQKIGFVFAGSVLVKQPRFQKQVSRLILEKLPGSQFKPMNREAVWGAVTMAREIVGKEVLPNKTITGTGANLQIPRSLRLSPTEERNPRSMDLDQLTIEQSVKLMIEEETRVGSAVKACQAEIVQSVRLIVKAFERGGRLFYVGAGTSGRLGVLDASECPPTFRTPPDQVQGIIAGGQTALWKAVEGAEDDYEAGKASVQFRGVKAGDVVVGIAASGRTPFVWGALSEAQKAKAKTILLCFNPYLEIPRRIRPGVVIAPPIGPELLTGSTRLKSGTATKLILNMFTTLAMVQMGKVVSNLMVDLNPSNVKLRDRAARMVKEITGAEYDEAWSSLEKAQWVVKDALTLLAKGSAPSKSSAKRSAPIRSGRPRKSLE